MKNNGIILSIKNVKKYFPVTQGVFSKTVGQVKAVDGVSFEMQPGETLGLVGESGCGKTTLGRVILQLIRATEGEIRFKDSPNLVALSNHEVRPYRRKLQMIFQDPFSSLNPRMTIGSIVGEGLTVYNLAKGKKKQDRIAELLKVVGINPEHMYRYPHEFSGGQRQRIGIARALAVEPDLIIADEPVSSLDVSIQAQIINLLQNLQTQFKLSYLLIAHDLAVVEHVSDRVAVMYLGKIVEITAKAELYQTPLHPYTKALLSAVPIPDPKVKVKRIPLPGDVPSPINVPTGCRFHTRCPIAQFPICKEQEPDLLEKQPTHFAACHFA
ncbi:MAG: ATP-binding cassette domain-containing protein [bacterium]|nr:ATP-binding cassette domain-containing protein [bacterium]